MNLPIQFLTSLNQVTSTIVYELKKVGIYHYNKLTYLFEYLFIKNFGTRYTNEKFIKLPHGPVISNYKKQITDLTQLHFYNTNLEELNKSRKLVEDDYAMKIYIYSNDNTKELLINNLMVYDFLLRVLEKYAYLNTDDLEKIIYNTLPMKKYIEKMKKGFKKPTGGYVLDSSNISVKECAGELSKARKILLKHVEKYPFVNLEQQKKFEEEFSYLEKLRPEW